MHLYPVGIFLAYLWHASGTQKDVSNFDFLKCVILGTCEIHFSVSFTFSVWSLQTGKNTDSYKDCPQLTLNIHNVCKQVFRIINFWPIATIHRYHNFYTVLLKYVMSQNWAYLSPQISRNSTIKFTVQNLKLESYEEILVWNKFHWKFQLETTVFLSHRLLHPWLF